MISKNPLKNARRALKPLLELALENRPAVYLNGPRQAGKSTLAQSLDWQARYITFDDMNMRLAARRDPQGFIESLTNPVILDEIQYVPELYLPIKKKIDETRLSGEKVNGLFLLTGSTNVMALPDLAKALVGRVSIMTLYPLSGGEAEKLPEEFIELIFSGSSITHKNSYPERSLLEMAQRATFPEVAKMGTPHYSVDAGWFFYPRNWYEDYVQMLIQRDVKAVGEIEKQEEMYRLLQVLAGRAAQLVNETNISQDIGLSRITYKRYQSLLEQVFLIRLLPAWHEKIIKRIAKSSKVFFNDTMLLCHLLRVDPETFDPASKHKDGHILENFVYTELMKQISRIEGYNLYHFRTSEGKEVDFLIERQDRKIAAIEVKSRKTIKPEDFKVLEFLRDNLKDRFENGVILYLGRDVISYGDRITAMPIESLWYGKPEAQYNLKLSKK